jgi:prevent-host-death family protein
MYISRMSVLYTSGMDVAISDLRAHLSDWLERARQGTEVVITDRGLPVARLLGLSTTATIERLTAEGVIGRPERAARPVAAGQTRPRSRRPVADLVSEQRD